MVNFVILRMDVRRIKIDKPIVESNEGITDVIKVKVDLLVDKVQSIVTDTLILVIFLRHHLVM